jgi:hypothetical protein
VTAAASPARSIALALALTGYTDAPPAHSCDHMPQPAVPPARPVSTVLRRRLRIGSGRRLPRRRRAYRRV